MTNKLKVFSAVALTATVLSGCASNQFDRPQSTEFEDGALLELRNAAIEARDELRLLAKTRDSIAQESMTDNQRRQRFEQAVNIPAGFEKNVTIRFTGEAHKATEMIGKMAGYERVVIQGRKPRTPLIVSLDMKNRPLNDALRELGLQTGDGAMIEIYPSEQWIKFTYTDTDTQAGVRR